MLGWHITVYQSGDVELRKGPRGVLTTDEVPRPTNSDNRLAVWQARLDGIEWLDALVDAGKAKHTARGGYPDSYLIRCDDFRVRLEAGLPSENASWVSDPGDVLDPERWLGKTTIDREQLQDCDPEEWLLVEVWDES